ncbi:MAG: hypothetical protein ACR2MO_04915 [Acidimicrobiales bacterium]
MNEADADPMRAALQEHNALSVAWQQVDHQELAAALKRMPTKLRNRVLSAHRTPSSKVTAMTARLLVTNLARGVLHDRLRAADTITAPVIHDMGHAVDSAMSGSSPLTDIGVALHGLAEGSGPSIVVLATVTGMLGEPDRFAPALVAAADEGLLSAELEAAADAVRPAVAHLVDDARMAAGPADAQEEWQGSEELEALRDRWAEAIEAAERISEQVRSGQRPVDDDIGAVGYFGVTLDDAAARLGTVPTVDAVVAATEATHARQAALALAQRLRSLSGPSTLADQVGELYDAAGLVEDDPALAARLARFLEIFGSGSALERFAVARELRSQPSPPDPVLIDAALAGLLTVEPTAAAPAQVGGSMAAEPEAPAAAAPEAPGQVVAADGAGAVVPVDIVRVPGEGAVPVAVDGVRDGAPVVSQLTGPEAEPAGPAPMVEAPAAAPSVGPDAEDPASAEAAAGTPSADEAPATDTAGVDIAIAGGASVRTVTGAETGAEAGPLPDTPDATPASPSTSDAEPVGDAVATMVSSSDAEPLATSGDVDPSPGRAEHSESAAIRARRARSASERLVGTDPATAPASAPEGPAALEEPTPDEISAILTGLVRERRFGLAQHLAAVLGQNYRAEILAEAALAQVVRSTASPAAAEMVTRMASTPLNASDIGSIVLRVAATTRVALLDPTSGAPAVLPHLIPSLGELPKLCEFVLAVSSATARNLVLPAAGVAVDAAEAEAQAKAIASWAEDTLRRPARQNRLYRGIEMWKQWTTPGGPLGSILSAVASNDRARVAEVRQACLRLSDRSREEMVDATDKALREGRAGAAQRITGAARKHLLRGMEEIVAQALLWCETHPEAPAGNARGLRDELAQRALRLRHPLDDELGRVGSDDWSRAAATAAAEIVAETIGLLRNESLQGPQMTPLEALNRGLALVEGLPLDAELQPEEAPTAAQLVWAATTPRSAAFTSRLGAGDFFAAESIIELSIGAGDGFDDAAARQDLRSRERDELARMEMQWAALDGRFAAARSRGRISHDDASRLHGQLLQAQPRSSAADFRRDLGRVAHELAAVAGELDEAAGRRREVVSADVADAIATDELAPGWKEKLADLLDRDELGAAEEYLHRARAGGPAPDSIEIAAGPDSELGRILAGHTEGVTAEVVEAARSGGSVGILDFSGVADIDRPSVAAALDAWRALCGHERPADLGAALEPVLGLLGLIPTSVERSQALRSVSSKGRWFVDVHGDRSGHAYVPDFGSRAAGRRRFMLCWDDLPMSQLWDLAAANAPVDQPVYVLRMAMMSSQARVELVRHASRCSGQEVVVIDDAVILRCAIAGRQSYDITMRTVLPYAAPNPYDPDLLTGTPEEMFYGRRAERQKVKAPAGSSFISGGRRLGKTALLRSVQSELLGSDVLALLIVIQHVAAVPPSDPCELWPVLAARLIEAQVLEPGTEGTADAVSAGVRAWLGDNPGRRLLLLLDECDFFLRADASSSFANVVCLRDLMQYGDGRFKVVFSGLQHVARYRRLPNQPLSHLPQPLVIGPLDAASGAALVRQPLHALGWNVSDAQVDRLVTFCACNPSVIQLACGQLLERLRTERIETLAPWPVPEEVLNEMLRSPEVERGVRDRLFLTLELDHRYKLLAYLLASLAISEGLGVPVSPADLRRQAVEHWPEGFAGQNPDDVRALCDELVGLGVFAGSAEAGYRMLSPATVRLFGSVEEIMEELFSASGTYEPNVTAGAAGNRMALGDGRYSPLTASQLADVVGAGATQLRVVVGSRALRAEAVPDALAAAARRLPGVTTKELTGTSRRLWRDSMTAPAEGHIVVVSDMTLGRSVESWEQSIDSARRRGIARTAKGTRSAVLVAGPSERWILRQVVTTTDGRRGPLADVAVGLRRVDMPALRAWDRIEELDLAHPARQQRLLMVTGGWPMLVERLIARMRQRPFDDAADELAAHLASQEGAAELLGAVGLDPADPDQPADAGLVACFARLAAMDLQDPPALLADLLGIDEELFGEDDPAEAVAILSLLGMLVEDENGLVAAEPVLAACARLAISPPVTA